MAVNRKYLRYGNFSNRLLIFLFHKFYCAQNHRTQFIVLFLDLIRDWVEKSDPSNSLDDDDSQSAISSSECASSVVAESDISDLTGNFENVHLPSNYMKDVPANIFYVNDLKNTQNITPIDATLQNCSNVHIGKWVLMKPCAND